MVISKVTNWKTLWLVVSVKRESSNRSTAEQGSYQVFCQIFIDAVVEASDGGIDAQVGQEFLRHLGRLGEHQIHSHLKREFAAPDFGDQISTAVAGGLPQSQ